MLSLWLIGRDEQAVAQDFYGPDFSTGGGFNIFGDFPGPPAPSPQNVPAAQIPGIEAEESSLDEAVGDTSGEMPLDTPVGGGFEGIISGGEGVFWDFPVTLIASVRQGYDTNVFTTKNNPIASAFTNGALGLEYEFGGRRLQLALQMGGGVTYYYDRPGRKEDYNGNITFSLDYEVNRRLAIAIDNTTRYIPQPQITETGGGVRFDNEYFFQNTVIGASYQLRPRLSSVTTYTFTAYYYTTPEVNDSSGRISQTLAESIRFQLYPSTVVSLIYRVNPVNYYAEDLESFGQFLLLGVDQTFSPRFRLSMQGGAEYRRSRNPIDGVGTTLTPFFESALVYNYGQTSAVSWTTRYGTEAADIRDVNQTQVFRTTLGVNHALTRRLSLSLSATYQNRYYDQANVISEFTENLYQINLGARFQVNRQISLQAGYTYTTLIVPESPGREYTRQVVFIGGSISI